MTQDHMTRLFFDASCLIAASGSPNGGSSFMLSLCRQNLFCAATSQYVLLEAHRNIGKLNSKDAEETYRNIFVTTPFLIASVPFPIPQFPTINQKDRHVVAAAIDVSAPYLITLDKPLIHEVEKGDFQLQALLPSDFIKSILPKI